MERVVVGSPRIWTGAGGGPEYSLRAMTSRVLTIGLMQMGSNRFNTQDAPPVLKIQVFCRGPIGRFAPLSSLHWPVFVATAPTSIGIRPRSNGAVTINLACTAGVVRVRIWTPAWTKRVAFCWASGDCRASAGISRRPCVYMAK